ncbi:hypothetical protein J6590_103265 [Homalodisca vitripennis]|nr:hypothetical protein J6590_103265 [Homalodisca vitripennis]
MSMKLDTRNSTYISQRRIFTIHHSVDNQHNGSDSRKLVCNSTQDLSNLLNNQVSSSFLLESINFRVPARSTRHQRLFEPDHVGTNYLRFIPIPRLMRFGNDIGSSVDLFVLQPWVRFGVLLLMKA